MGKETLLDAAARRLAAGFVVLFCEEKRRELCECTETVCNFFGEDAFEGIERQIVVSNL